jgi:acetyl esterase
MKTRGRAMFLAVVVATVMSATAEGQGRKPRKHNGPSPAQQLMETATKLVYKKVGDEKLPLFIFNPLDLQPGEQRAAIIFFHGAGGQPRAFARQCRHLASRGMVAITAGRRDSDPMLGGMRDGRSAVRWVRSHAAELSIDPARIACAGGSKGGGIALATALSEGIDNEGDDLSISPVPGALVLFNPGLGTGVARKRNDTIDVKPEDVPLLGRMDHLQNLTGDTPPMIIFHGTADKSIPFAEVAEFEQKARSLMVRCVLVPYQGRGHSFFDEGRDYRDTLDKADRFLTSLGYLPPR